MINVKLSKIEIYQGKLSKFDCEITCNDPVLYICRIVCKIAGLFSENIVNNNIYLTCVI